MGLAISDIVLVVLVVLIIYVVFLSIKIVPQSKVFVIERFGKFTRILESGPVSYTHLRAHETP